MLLLFNPEQTTGETVMIGGWAVPMHGTQGAGVHMITRRSTPVEAARPVPESSRIHFFSNFNAAELMQ
jgi:hypothetical protein